VIGWSASGRVALPTRAGTAARQCGGDDLAHPAAPLGGRDAHLRFDPLELLERLAVLTPRPRVNLMLYYRVLAPRAAWRRALVSATSHGVETSHVEPSMEDDDAGPSRPGADQSAE
jgi:hypothetical protein